MSGEYKSPLTTRYAGNAMQLLFSEDKKFRTWRQLWIALAKAEQELGIPITDEQIEDMEQHKNAINYAVAQAREHETRHDVMSHVYAYGQQTSIAADIIHLGATSTYVGDNTDIIIMKEALELVRIKVVNVIALLAKFANQYKSLPTLAYTHLQPAQLTTVGKRATLWAHDLCMDLEDLEYRINNLKLLGSKGANGTQSSFMQLFNGDMDKVCQLEKLIAQQMGFSDTVPVSGQTYSRKVDFQVLSVLSGIAQSASKFSYDLRLLQGFSEIAEPFGEHQIGSSTMPYKRNPMRCERITGLSRYVIADLANPSFTAATQWLERTLDDSANRRITISEAFLATDGILNLLMDVCSGIVVYPKVIERNIKSELPFMATEKILLHCVANGADKAELTKHMHKHMQSAVTAMKEEAQDNDLLERIAADDMFDITLEDMAEFMHPENYVGLAVEQTEAFLNNTIIPILEKNKCVLGQKANVNV